MNLQAIVLSREDWRENDCLLTLYTRERGKVEAVAKGLRKFESKLAAHLEPLTLAEIFMVEGRRWPIVAGSIVHDRHELLRDDLTRLAAAGLAVRLAELMTTHENPDSGVFDLLVTVLQLLAVDTASGGGPLVLLALFAWKLLCAVGYHPELKNCIVCHRAVAEATVLLNPRRGGVAHGCCLDVKQTNSVAVSRPALNGLAYMARAPLTDAPRLRASSEAFDDIIAAVQALVEERFEVPAAEWFASVS